MTIIDQDRPASAFEAAVRSRLAHERSVLERAERERDDVQQVISAGVIHDLEVLAEHNDVALPAG